MRLSCTGSFNDVERRNEIDMKNLVRTLMLIAACSAALARADTLAAFTDDDWAAAARASLDAVEHQRRLTLVLDDSLSPAARRILGGLRDTVAREALPEQDKYILPPGD